VVEPRFRSVPKHSRSLGGDIARFAEGVGVHLDGWQQDALDVFSGVRGHRRRWASPTNYLLVSRQNGKSLVMLVRALYGLFVLEREMILYSSHQWASSNEVFLSMKGIIEANPELQSRVKNTRLSAAQLGFELHTGGRILFLTRSRAAARGFSGDEIYFDECHFLSEAGHAAIRPTLGGRSAKGTTQTFYCSSAVDQTRHPDGLVAARLRARGIAGEDEIAFVEYSAGVVDGDGREILPALIPAAVCVDPEVLQRANPGCPGRISLDFLIDEARTLDPASFAVEHLGQGDWPDLDGARSTAVDLDKWNGLADPESRPVPPVCLSFDVSPDRRRATVAIGGERLDGKFHIELRENAEGVGWVAPLLKQVVEDHDPYSIICDASQELLAEQVFQEVGVRPDLLDRGEVAQACASFVDLVEQGELRHLDDPILLDAIRAAGTTSVGGDQWAFSRRSSHVDISPLYASVFALMAARRMPTVGAELHIY
jgi:hypothetical protein